MTIEELRARLAEIRGRLQEIDNEYRSQELPEEARTEWNNLNEEFEERTTTLNELEARAARVEELNGEGESESREAGFQVGARTGRPQGEDIFDLSTIRSSVANPEEARSELRSRALTAIEQADFPHEDADADAVRSHIEHLMRSVKVPKGQEGMFERHLLATGSELYRRAFGKALAQKPLTPEEARAMSLTDANGGFAVPYTLDPTIILTSNGAINPLRQIARIESIMGDEWRGVTSAGVTVSRASEGAEADDNSPTLAQPTANPTRVQGFIPFSIEIDGDWPSLQAEMAKLLQDAKDVEEATSFTNGDGTGNNPNGVVAKLGAGSQVQTAGVTTFAVGDLYKVKGALPARFRGNASWMAEDTIYSLTRQFDTSGGASLWAQLGEDRPEKLIGKPAYENTAMDSAITANKLIAMYGDFKEFLIVDRIGMIIELIPHLFGANGRPTGQRGMYAIWRNTSKILTDNAFRLLKVKAS